MINECIHYLKKNINASGSLISDEASGGKPTQKLLNGV